MLPGRKSVLSAAVFFVIIQTAVCGNRVWAAEKNRVPDQRVMNEKKKGEVILESEILFNEWNSYIPEGRYKDQNGKKYWLKEWHLEPCRIPEHRESVERTVLYEEVEWEDQIPKQAAIVTRDRVTGKRIQRNYPIIQRNCNKERWLDDFSFTAVFHSYGADYYQLGTKKIPFNSLQPGLKKYEKELLTQLGVNPSKYIIHDAVWKGNSYLDKKGNPCRNAIITGEKKVADYHVKYGGEVVFPEAEGLKCVAVYKGFNSVTENWNPIEEKLVEPITFPAGNQKQEIWMVYRKQIVITLSILLVGGVIFLVIYLVYRRKRKKIRTCSSNKEKGNVKHEENYW